MKTPRRFIFLLLLLAPAARPVAADTVVVAPADGPVTRLSRDEAEQVYLGRTQVLAGGVAVIPVDLPAGPLRDAFYAGLTGKNPLQIRAHWSRMVFTGRALPPREAASVEEALAWLAAIPNMIAYLPEEQVRPGMRILLRLP